MTGAKTAGPHRWALSLVMILLAACGGGRSPTEPQPPPGPGLVCTGYSDWRTSPYVLPYPVGTAYVVLQGNCKLGGTHNTIGNQYSYDFMMPIGTLVTAAREGRVEIVTDKYPDFNERNGGNNEVVIIHEDGTKSVYHHLEQNSAMVRVGQLVRKGDPIALSGASALGPRDTPHLHYNAAEGPASIPVTFRNTDPNPNGLQQGVLYPALPY